MEMIKPGKFQISLTPYIENSCIQHFGYSPFTLFSFLTSPYFPNLQVKETKISMRLEENFKEKSSPKN